MDYRNEIIDLCKTLNKLAAEERDIAKTDPVTYTRGLSTGYASAYELCAKWLKEILEDPQ